MDKPFLLMAGMNYYPMEGTNDWIGRYATLEEAEEAAAALNREEEHDWRCIDWVEIVDLRTWEK